MRLSLALVSLALLAGCASVSPEAPLFARVSQAEDWAVFTEETPEGRLCWVAASPVASSTEGGLDQTRRGVFLMTQVAPESGAEVSYVGGWPLARGGVNLSIGVNSYPFFAEGPVAWIDDGFLEPDLVDDLRRGREAVVRSVSSEGQVSADRFSLYGYTAALDEAEQRCA